MRANSPLSGIFPLSPGMQRPTGGAWGVTLPEWGGFLWVLALLAAPVGIFKHLPPHVQQQLFVEPHAHLLIESFCGLTALTVGGMLLAVCVKRFVPSLMLFALGFVLMGVFDVLHAVSDPEYERAHFVLYHTLSTVLGAVFVASGVVAHLLRQTHGGLSRADGATLFVGLAAAVLVAFLYRYSIPSLFPGRQDNFQFAAVVHAAHYLAGVLYMVSALAFYRYYRTHRQVLALVVASLLIVFAQSAYLFSFSSLWNLSWWMWHGAKLLFYLGTMLAVSVGFLLALRTIENSRRVLASVNQRLEQSQVAIRRVNRELEIRNRMVQESMRDLNLDHAMDSVSDALRQMLGLTSCELFLHVPGDAADEFDRRMRRMNWRWSVRALRWESGCGDSPCPPRQTESGAFECAVDPASGTSLCLSLSANGEEVGQLRLRKQTGNMPAHSEEALRALGSEIGVIIHNTLLYQQRLEANEFRAALLKISAMLTSTLDLDRVLEAVCQKSAPLFESDGALVWLPRGDGNDFFLAAQWFAETDQDISAEVANWCSNGEECSRVLQGISGRYTPLSILWQDRTKRSPISRPNGCPWESLALFPLLDGPSLVGVMVLTRKEPVRFSQATLDKGELLAGQVRIAINNARSYARLSEFNRQLQAAEENKIRSERMAVMGQMAASVAHEVRNPLAAINNCLAVLRPDVAHHARSRAALEIIQDEVERLSNLTTNFLSFGKPRAPVSKPMVLERVVRKVCERLERHIEQERLSIHLVVTVEHASSLLLFDVDGLETVLWNLLLNASQAIQGAGRIDVTLRHYPGYFMLAVADTGKGISRDAQKRIFEPFFSQRPLGAGLGLAIVQRLVIEWGGRMRLRSAEGRGTAFFLRVPALIQGELPEHEVA